MLSKRGRFTVDGPPVRRMVRSDSGEEDGILRIRYPLVLFSEGFWGMGGGDRPRRVNESGVGK